MELGRTIKYYRIKHNMTQAELADGICSIPHLSKIENSIYNANFGTAALLLERLGINIEEEYAQHSEIKHTLDAFIEAIQFADEEKALEYYESLFDKETVIPRTNYRNMYHLYMMRYHLMNGHLTLAFKDWSIVDKNRSNLDPIEELSAELFYGIYLVELGRLKEAKQLLLSIKNAEHSSHYLFAREIAFILSHCYTELNEPEKAIIYAKEALYLFKQEDNYIRTAQSQMVLGINYTQLNMLEESLRVFKVLLRNSRLFGQQSLYFQATYNYGILLKKSGDYEASHDCFLQCTNFYEPSSKNYLYARLADVEVLFLLNAEKTSIRDILVEIIEQSVTQAHERLELQARYYMYRLESSEQLYHFIETELLPHLERLESHAELLPYARELAHWYQQNGHYEKANEYLQKYSSISTKKDLSMV
ncbi:helix-turn-helix transcriptional regulator [Shouchella miscanthi]|uniref:Helix-turn-helix transcriptional regulator n=1 Tax=Shouchella miscanthi TaxID=2598861 RepID=A0ABU6NEN8_9BACI|nr:helix-turn-helix transcriptional regulator [Shouchella miscanthi]